MNHKRECGTIVKLHKAGMKTADIVPRTGFKKSTVYDAVERFKETGETADRPRSGRPTTAATAKNVQKVRCRIYQNSERSMRELTKDKISEGSVRNISGARFTQECLENLFSAIRAKNNLKLRTVLM